MRHLAIVAAAVAAAIPSYLQGRAINEERIADIERRLFALERSVMPAPPVKLWGAEEAAALNTAALALYQGPARLTAFAKPGAGIPESGREISRDAERATMLMWDAEKFLTFGRPQLASELCEEALMLYNRAARALKLPERTRESR